MTTRKALDQVLGKTAAAGLKPAVSGTTNRRLAGLVKRTMGVADAIGSIIAARDSGDPAAEAIASKLLENKDFIGALLAAVQKIKEDIAAKPAAAAAAEPKPDDVGQVGPEHPESDPEAKAGADSAAMPGSYTVAHLINDIATQKGAVLRLAAKSGMDSAMAQVAASPLIPPWDSPIWTADARQYMRDRASHDGTAAAHIAKGGGSPTYQSQYQLTRDTEAFMDRFGAAVEPQQHPRSFDR